MATAKDDMESDTRVGWIYRLSKEQLIEELRRYDIDTEGTVRELRQKLSNYLQEKPSLQYRLPSPEQRDKQEELNRRLSELHIERPNAGAVPKSANRPQINSDIGDIMDKVRKWGLYFDGKKDPMMFLERLQELKDCYKIAEEHLLLALPEFFRGYALLWYRNNKTSWRCWNDFCREFNDFFLPANFRIKLEDEIRNRTQGAKETIKEYVTALSTLLRRHGGFSKESELERTYNNMRPEYKLYVRRRDFRNLQQLMDLANDFENLQLETKTFRPPPPMSQTLITETAYHGKYVVPLSPLAMAKAPEVENKALENVTKENRLINFNSRTDCWRCGKSNHQRNACKNKPRLFCAVCGKLNTLTRDCHPLNLKRAVDRRGSHDRR